MNKYVLKNTRDKMLDGIVVHITGIAYDWYPMPGTIYIIEREDGESFYTQHGYYKNVVMTETCLEKIEGD